MFSALTELKQTIAHLKVQPSVVEDGNTMALLERIERDVKQIRPIHDFSYVYVDEDGDEIEMDDTVRRVDVDEHTGEPIDRRALDDDTGEPVGPEPKLAVTEKLKNDPRLFDEDGNRILDEGGKPKVAITTVATAPAVPVNPVMPVLEDAVDLNDPMRRIDRVTGESYDPRDVTSDPARRSNPQLDVINPEKNKAKPTDPDQAPLVAAGGDVGAPFSSGLGANAGDDAGSWQDNQDKGSATGAVNTSKSIKKTK